MRRALAAALILGLAACAAPGPDGDAPATGPRPVS
ncbi:glycerophosphodiester phosphodiesterase, partial [Paracoccus aestuarii]